MTKAQMTMKTMLMTAGYEATSPASVQQRSTSVKAQVYNLDPYMGM